MKIIRSFLVCFILLLVLGGSVSAQTCPTGFILEKNNDKYNCRNPACDAGLNFYGESVDTGTPMLPDMDKDFDGMPRPKVKGPDGKWVGWTIGAYQCPPDTIGLHPNPDWPCGFDYCPKNKPAKPINLKIVNLEPKYTR